jgi:hypothetical protein
MTIQTEQLIERLSKDLSPSLPLAVERRMAGGLVAGMAVCGLMMAVGLGVRADLMAALHGFTFWMKSGYVAALAAIAAAAALRLARPDVRPPVWLWLLVLPVLIIAGLALAELIRTPSQDWLALWLGKSWFLCPFLVFGLSVPIFFGLVWAQKKLAPTRLRSAGALAGLTAGASAALIYCLHCPESSAAFLLTWYSGGIGLTTLAGALLGPRLLRW